MRAATSYSHTPGRTVFIAARCASTEASTALRISAISPGDFTMRRRGKTLRESAKVASGAAFFSRDCISWMKHSSPLSGCGVISV